MDDIKAFLKEQDCLACGCPGPSDIHHIKSRGSGGKDDPWNMIPLCRQCHADWHYRGWRKFLEKHPKVKQYLLDLEWSVVSKLWHYGSS